MSETIVNSQSDMPPEPKAPILEAQPALPLDEASIQKAFRQRVKPYSGQVSGGLGAAFVTLIPVFYFVFLACVAYCVIVLSLKTKPELKAGMPSLRGFLAWFAPIAAGLVLLYYMIRPLLRKSTEQAREIELTRGDQPLVFLFLKELSANAGVPMPQRVFADCGTRVRARGSNEKSGGKNAPDLVIGLSAVAAFGTRKFAAAVVSELGRFRDGGESATRVRRIYDWLSGVVRYRDSLDLTLDEMAEKQNAVLRTLGIFMRWMVRILRGLIDGMLSTVAMLGRKLTWDQQFAADHSAAQVSGPLEFNTMLMQYDALALTDGIAHRNLRRIITNSLPANYPEYVADSVDKIPDAVRRPFQDQQNAAKSGVPQLDPSRTKRIGNLCSLDRTATLDLDVPASGLFCDYESLCAEATIYHYEAVYGEEYKKAWLRPNPEFMTEIGYAVFLPSTLDTIIDYHEGDRWHKHLKRLSTVCGLIMTVGLVIHAGNQIKKAGRSEESIYREHIGRRLFTGTDGLRTIQSVQYGRKGEPFKSDEKRAPKAPATGWYYDTGDNVFVNARRAVFMDDEEVAGLPEESEDMKLVREQMEINEKGAGLSNSAGSDE